MDTSPERTDRRRRGRLQAAISAAIWAIDEAVSRDVPPRIVQALPIEKDSTAPADGFSIETQYAESSLRTVTAAVKGTKRPVKVETDILWGPLRAHWSTNLKMPP